MTSGQLGVTSSDGVIITRNGITAEYSSAPMTRVACSYTPERSSASDEVPEPGVHLVEEELRRIEVRGAVEAQPVE